MKIDLTTQKLNLLNQNCRYEDPLEIIEFSLEISKNPVLTTSFGAYSAALLHAVTTIKPDIPVIWCDTGYNTESTYKHAHYLIEKLELNISIYTPKYTTAFIESKVGKPLVGNPNHEMFSEATKLEPFRRALDDFKPDLWFTNLRDGQTIHRNSLDVFHLSKDNILKVAPFYHFKTTAVKEYISKHDLPLEFDYFDPVKAIENRECGIHLNH